MSVIIEETDLPGLYVIDLEPHRDDRGFFARTWCANEFADAGLAAEFVQASISYNATANTLRGMHFQREPYGETKLIRCEAGAVYDVIIDLRPDSDTYTNWLGWELTADRGRQLYVPAGMAHGFQTLVDNTVVSYNIDTFHQPGHGDGVRWDDPAFAIDWPDADRRIMSDKDRNWPDFHSPSDRRLG